jgi:hypothetical protein
MDKGSTDAEWTPGKNTGTGNEHPLVEVQYFFNLILLILSDWYRILEV